MVRSFVSVFSMDTTGELKIPIWKVAKAACSAGYAVVPLPPMSSRPIICTLTARERKAAGPDHDCGIYHYVTDPAKAERLFKRIQGQYEDRLNIGIVAHPSRIVVIDTDQAAGVQAAGDYLAELVDVPWTPTVYTPGRQDTDGRWIHKDGGHFIMTIPDGVELPLGRHVIVDPRGFDIRWGMNMTAAPPSVRKEGAYVARGNVPEVPQALLERILADCEAYAARPTFDPDQFLGNDLIASWSVTAAWQELLERHGWQATGKRDSCGCPTWEKPGGGTTSTKSATAHEAGCSDSHYANAEGHGALHLWTTDPPAALAVWCAAHSTQTLTKLQFVAAMEYEGDVEAAKVGLGLEPDLDWLKETEVSGSVEDTPGVETTDLPSEDRPMERMTELSRLALVAHGLPAHLTEKLAQKASGASLDMLSRTVAGQFLGTQRGVIDTWMVPDDMADQWTTATSVDPPNVLHTIDTGKGLLYRGKVNVICGRRGSGKTWVADLAAVNVLEAGGRVIYLDMEDTMAAMKDRFSTIGFNMDPYVRSGHFAWVRPGGMPQGDMVPLIDHLSSFDLVVFDVMNRLLSRMDANIDAGNTEIMWLSDNLFDPVANQGSCVLVLDHPNKRGQRSDARSDDLDPAGGALKLNNLTGAAYALKVHKAFTRDDPKGTVDLVTLKDRSGHYAEGDVAAQLRGDMDLGEHGGIVLKLTFHGSDIETDESREQRLIEQTKSRVLEILAEHGPLAKSHVKRLLSKSQQGVWDTALSYLVVEKKVVETGARLSLPGQESDTEKGQDTDPDPE